MLTGLTGTSWVDAAATVPDEVKVPVRVVVVDRDARDAHGEWHRRSEIEEDGVLLVRPDCYVAWRRPSGAAAAPEATRDPSTTP